MSIATHATTADAKVWTIGKYLCWPVSDWDAISITTNSKTWPNNIALSATGRLAYGVTPPPIHEVVWVDRDGTESSIDPASPMRGMRFVSLSPDDTKLAMNTWLRRPRDDGQLWVKALPRGPLQQLTFEGEVNFRPSWLPSGRSLAFVSDRAGDRDVWMMPIDGSGDAELVLDQPEKLLVIAEK